MAMEVIYHPLFERWLAALAKADDEISATSGIQRTSPRPNNDSRSLAVTKPASCQL